MKLLYSVLVKKTSKGILQKNIKTKYLFMN